jgi:hypothetical protein
MSTTSKAVICAMLLIATSAVEAHEHFGGFREWHPHGYGYGYGYAPAYYYTAPVAPMYVAPHPVYRGYYAPGTVGSMLGGAAGYQMSGGNPLGAGIGAAAGALITR